MAPLPVSSHEYRAVAPAAVILLPVAFAAHLAEEWFGGFLDWTPDALGYELTAARFLVINGVALVIFAAGSLAAIRWSRVAWMGVSVAALLGLNGVLHIFATIGFGSYSPGVVTGLLIYIPLSVIVLRASANRMRGSVFSMAIVLGVVLHGLVPVLAFS